MFPADMAAALANALQWQLVISPRKIQLTTGQSTRDGQAIVLCLQQAEGNQFTIHDDAMLFARLRRRGYFTGRGRLAAFQAICQAVCKTHGVILQGERLQRTASPEHAEEACRAVVQAVIDLHAYADRASDT